MMHTFSKRVQAYFGWCPNHPGAHVQTRDPMTGQVDLEISDPETPQPGTSKEIITVNHWMTAGASAILIATCFFGGNIWWSAFVLIISIAYIIIYIRVLKETGGHQ